MIIGTGIDLLDTRRLEKLLSKYGPRFQGRYFTDRENNRAARHDKNSAALLTYAKRFAAKEACAKALGTGIIEGIYMKDIEVVNNERGKPELILYNGALKRLQEMLPTGTKPFLHLSLTDEPPYAQAQVIIEAL